MVEFVTCLKFLAHGSNIACVGATLRLKALKEVQLAVELHTVALACAATHVERLGCGQVKMAVGKTRSFHQLQKFKFHPLSLAGCERTQILSFA